MPKTVTLTKVPLTDSYVGSARWQFVLRAIQYDDDGNPLPNQTIADRLYADVRAPVTRDDGNSEEGRGHGLAKDAVVAGAITLAEGQTLKSVLKKLYDYYLASYA